MFTFITREEAKAKGLKVYSLGVGCVRGGHVERYVSTGSCRQCQRDSMARYRGSNREKYLAIQRASRYRVRDRRRAEEQHV
jgi:hypothetical protein